MVAPARMASGGNSAPAPPAIWISPLDCISNDRPSARKSTSVFLGSRCASRGESRNFISLANASSRRDADRTLTGQQVPLDLDPAEPLERVVRPTVPSRSPGGIVQPGDAEESGGQPPFPGPHRVSYPESRPPNPGNRFGASSGTPRRSHQVRARPRRRRTRSAPGPTRGRPSTVFNDSVVTNGSDRRSRLRVISQRVPEL